MYNNREYKPTHISTAGTTQVFSGQGILHAVNVNASSPVIFGVYDGINASTVVIAKLKASVAEQTFLFDTSVSTGLYVEHAAGDYTVIWSKI